MYAKIIFHTFYILEHPFFVVNCSFFVSAVGGYLFDSRQNGENLIENMHFGYFGLVYIVICYMPNQLFSVYSYALLPAAPIQLNLQNTSFAHKL